MSSFWQSRLIKDALSKSAVINFKTGNRSSPREDSDPVERKQHIGFALFLESHSDETVLGNAVRHFQPSPAFSHVELIMPPDKLADSAKGTEMYSMFATYIGEKAGFSGSFSNPGRFYIHGPNGGHWRAVPIVFDDASERLRAECRDHVDTLYPPLMPFVFNYALSVPPGRSFASYVKEDRYEPAHCAALTARIIERAIPEAQLPYAPSYYGPSSLYLELTRKCRCEKAFKDLAGFEPIKSIPEQEEERRWEETGVAGLLGEIPMDELDTLKYEECMGAAQALSKDVIVSHVSGDATEIRANEKKLAKVLLNWLVVRNGHASNIHQDTHLDGKQSSVNWGRRSN
ncbi:MAG: hypothetical protein CMM02_14225 [Rhodopirellula sp.]|jgi:hypothetical protein|nr:hypothetical protein [Rhodopirellula sp.]